MHPVRERVHGTSHLATFAYYHVCVFSRYEHPGLVNCNRCNLVRTFCRKDQPVVEYRIYAPFGTIPEAYIVSAACCQDYVPEKQYNDV